MDGDRRICALIIVLLCLVQDYGSCSEIIEGPQNVTVLTGSNASFLCTIAAGWQSISWYLKDVYVVSIGPTGPSVSYDYIHVRNSTNAITGAFTSEMTIINVNKSNSGPVRCSSLLASIRDAYLSVQVKGSILITNGSVTVKPNTTISMVCRASDWHPAPAITWKMNDTLASNLYYFTEYIAGADSFVTAVSTFKIIPEGDMGLTCLASISTLNEPQSATVNVAVREQIQGSGPFLSRTDIILIAVFGSLAGLLLLIAIIVIIVICCRRKKKRETSYQSDTWKSPEKNVSDLKTIESDSLGESNFGYTPEPRPVGQSFHPSNDRNSTYSDESSISRNYAPQVLGREQTDEYLKNVRRVTHV
ncbi:immunoglobulin superfamily member 5 [Mixophyes fleayi]|uniref:immunoglobulin superfamily member 5 n=1 Tax=Mixophyes fleayi TaxID=3061075 RepID=UPI003F4DE54E